MFIAVLFLIAQNTKQLKRPSSGEWINKLWYTLEYYASIKRNELLVHETWVNLKIITLNEKSLTRANRYYFIRQYSRKCKLLHNSDRKLLSGCLGTGVAGRDGRENLQRGTRKLPAVMDMIIILFVVLIAQVYKDDETYQTVHFKHEQFIVCQLPVHDVGENWVQQSAFWFQLLSTALSSDLTLQAGAGADSLWQQPHLSELFIAGSLMSPIRL